MKISLFPKLTHRVADYDYVTRCPLCENDSSLKIGTLRRSAYRFGPVTIPLPREGVRLYACTSCDLLYKDRIPTPESLAKILEEAASEYWQEKPSIHPRAADVDAYLQGRSLLDIGASDGALLRSVKGARLSAFDAVAYPTCGQHVTGEYIVSPFEHTAKWSGMPYDVVTGFDVFEHFMNTRKAIANLSRFVAPGGYLILETGNWRAVRESASWYYTNLFEHQVFWSRKSLAFLVNFGLCIERCVEGLHKGRLDWSLAKQISVGIYRALGLPLISGLATRTTGVDPRLLPPPHLPDHFFAVLNRT